MKTIRFTLAALFLAALSCLGPARATSFSTDQSDLWWDADESGWGVQLVQRGNVVYATMFVYNSNGNPTWYVAAMQGTKAGGVLTFTGDLYTALGPWFGAVPYDPSRVASFKVGTMTWQKKSGVPGTLSYSVSGVNVTKSLTRQPVGSDNYSGPYLGAFHLTASGCADPAKDITTNGGGPLVIAHDGSAFHLTLVDAGCSFHGTYAQNGQFGTVAGTYSCASGDAGTFEFANMIVTPVAMTGEVSTANPSSGCHGAGQISGVRTDK